MNSKKLFMAAVLVVALPMAALTSCSSDNDEPNGGSAGDGLDNEVVLSMLKGEKDKATKLDDNIYIGEDNNFQSDYRHDAVFSLVANVNKLGGITGIPKSGWAKKVAVRKGYGYVFYVADYYHDKGDFYRVYVEDEIRDTDGKVIGYNIRYQQPFYGKDTDIQLPKNELSFTANGGSEELKFLDNEPRVFSCSCDSSSSWCRATPSSSFDERFLTNAVYVSVEKSDTIAESTATITLTTGYGKKKEIKVTRGAAEPRMALYKDYGSYVTSMNLPVYKSDTVSISSNIPLGDIEVENTASSWCEAKLERNYGYYYHNYCNYILCVKATPNDTDDKRTGTITLKYRNGDTSVKLYVEQDVPYITIDNGYSEDNPYTCNYYSDYDYIYFKTNIDIDDIKVTNSANWLTADLDSNYRGRINLHVNSNYSSFDREDIVTISNKKGNVSCSFKVKQSGR